MLARALLQRQTYIRYGLASVVALGADIGLFMLLLRGGVGPAPAAALGYAAGILVHWLISSRLVFAGDAAPRGSRRMRQKGLFVVSALIGLALTTAIVTLASRIGLMPLAAKGIAVMVSFQLTYMLRKSVVFAA